MPNYDSVRVLIVDPNDFSRNLLCAQVALLGIKECGRKRHTNEVLSLLRVEHFDVIFCDEDAGDVAEFMNALRHDLSTCNIYVPVILVAQRIQQQQIEFARDVGMHDAIVKPVSAATIERKLNACLCAPRSFVNAKSYVGPDRRSGVRSRRAFERSGAPERRGLTSEPVTITRIPPAMLD